MLDVRGQEIEVGDYVVYAEMANKFYSSKTPAASVGLVPKTANLKWPKIQRIATTGTTNPEVRCVDPAKVLLLLTSEDAKHLEVTP